MRRCQFNFNNEVDTFEVHVEDDGRVIVPGEDGPLAEYDSMEQLAEIYAQARDVKPENLKNWVLLEHGDVYSFVLRAGTAGVDVCDVEEELDNVFASLADRHHALSIARAKEQIMRDGTVDLVDALVHCSETDVARDVYDAMSARINGTEVAVPAEEEPVDNRTDLEKYVDEMTEIPGAIGFFATLVGLPADTSKDDLLEAFNGSVVFSNVLTLRTVFENAVNETIRNGIGVNTVSDALTVMTQTAFGTVNNEAKVRMVTAARMAGRTHVNVSVDEVGEEHIRHTAERVALEDLETTDLFVRENVLYIIRFSDTVDAELEAEHNHAAAEEENQNQEEDYEDHQEEDYEDE